MRKGNFNATVELVVSIILLMAFVALIWYTWSVPTNDPQKYETNSDAVKCKTASDCTDSPYGSKCMILYPSDYKTFCGCATNADCEGRRGEVCGSDNICV
jgi:hypothetical protein